MNFSPDSKLFEGAATIGSCMGVTLPYSYTGPKDEYLAGRTSAWLGVCLNVTPVYVVSGPDAAKVFNSCCVNKDFSVMVEGQSKHALICTEQGHLVADGVVMKGEGTTYRTYWLGPVLQYYVENSGLDVHGEYVSDEYFFQIDGPKSLEIMEEATGTDLHDLKFAHNKHVDICGTDMVVHRLGMSGCLAYEVHGKAEDAEVAYGRIREVLESYGGKPQGIGSYGYMNHTVAGYPNQMQHYVYPYWEDEKLFEFVRDSGIMPIFSPGGSDKDCPEDYCVTPYDISWGYLVNLKHDFVGKDALVEAKAAQRRHVVTLEWNADDVGDVFASQFRGTDVEPYDALEYPQPVDSNYGLVHGDKVLLDGEKIGIAVGRTYAYYEQRMVSLAYLDTSVEAPEGTEVTVVWGDEGHPQKLIRATVAQFPYYQGEYRNETFDVEKIPHLADKQK